MTDESMSKPPPPSPDPAAADQETPPFRLTRTARIVTVAVTGLGVAVTLYFDLPKLPGYAITFVTATLAGALTHRLT